MLESFVFLVITYFMIGLTTGAHLKQITRTVCEGLCFAVVPPRICASAVAPACRSAPLIMNHDATHAPFAMLLRALAPLCLRTSSTLMHVASWCHRRGWLFLHLLAHPCHRVARAHCGLPRPRLLHPGACRRAGRVGLPAAHCHRGLWLHHRAGRHPALGDLVRLPRVRANLHNKKQLGLSAHAARLNTRAALT